MKSRTIKTLSLAIVLVTAPALQANEPENSSWLAPFSSNAFLYSALGISSAYILYKLYDRWSQPTELDVIAPWKEITSAPNTEDVKKREIPELDQLQEKISAYIDLFFSTYGPQLVSLHAQLANPELEEKNRIEIEHELAKVEELAPPFAESIPLIAGCMFDLITTQQQLLEQAEAQPINRSVFDAEYAPLLETMTMLVNFMDAFVELYGAEFLQKMQDFSEELQLEYNEPIHHPVNQL